MVEQLCALTQNERRILLNWLYFCIALALHLPYSIRMLRNTSLNEPSLELGLQGLFALVYAYLAYRGMKGKETFFTSACIGAGLPVATIASYYTSTGNLIGTVLGGFMFGGMFAFATIVFFAVIFFILPDRSPAH